VIAAKRDRTLNPTTSVSIELANELFSWQLFKRNCLKVYRGVLRGGLVTGAFSNAVGAHELIWRLITFWLCFLLAWVAFATAQPTAPVVVKDQVEPDSGAAALLKYRNLLAYEYSIPREIPPPSPPRLASTLFGMTWNTTSRFPPIPFGTMRLWDTGTSWQEIETSDGVFSWREPDSRPAQASAKEKDLYTFGPLPVWISNRMTIKVLPCPCTQRFTDVTLRVVDRLFSGCPI